MRPERLGLRTSSRGMVAITGRPSLFNSGGYEQVRLLRAHPISRARRRAKTAGSAAIAFPAGMAMSSAPPPPKSPASAFDWLPFAPPQWSPLTPPLTEPRILPPRRSILYSAICRPSRNDTGRPASQTRRRNPGRLRRFAVGLGRRKARRKRMPVRIADDYAAWVFTSEWRGARGNRRGVFGLRSRDSNSPRSGLPFRFSGGR